MRRRSLVAVTTSMVCGALLVVACVTDYQQGLEDPAFGGPNALKDKKQPGPSIDEDQNQAGAGNAGQPVCVKSGGALVDGGPCTVSFKTDILGAFTAANCQLAACHGGTTPPNQPRIAPEDPTGTWSDFASFTLSNGKPYINPCSTDPATATIACNVNNAAPCGAIMPPGAGLAADVVGKIDTWLKCGSPNN